MYIALALTKIKGVSYMIKPNGCFPTFLGRNPLDELDLPIEIGKRVLFNHHEDQTADKKLETRRCAISISMGKSV